MSDISPVEKPIIPITPTNEKEISRLDPENKNYSLWETIKNKLPFWKSKVAQKPGQIIQEISEIAPEPPNKKPIEPDIENQNQIDQQMFKKYIWEYANSEGEKSLDWALNLFEKYISNMTEVEGLGDPKDKIHVLACMYKIIDKDKTIDTTVTSIKIVDYSPNDPSVANLPEQLKTNMISIRNNSPLGGEKDEIEIQNDPKLARFWNLADSFYNKEIKILEEKGIADDNIPLLGINENDLQFVGPEFIKTYRQQINSNRMEDFSSYMVLNENLYEKSMENKIVTPESFFGHATTIDNFEQMLNDGLLKSPWCAQQNEAPKYGIREFGVDPAAIFFFSDKSRQMTLGIYANNLRASDLGIIFRFDTISKKGYTLGSKYGTNTYSEYFITASPEVFSANNLSPEQRYELALKDSTKLEIKDAYLRITNPHIFVKVTNLLKSNGLGEEWIKEHVVFNSALDSKKKLLEWLQMRRQPQLSENEKSTIYRPVKGCNDYYIWKPLPSNI